MITSARLQELYLSSFQCKDEHETKSVYDEWAPHYDDKMREYQWQAPVQIAQLLCQAFERPARAKARILDVGAGTGQSGLALGDLGFETIDAFDISESMLSYAKNRRVYRNIILGNAEKLDDYVERTYDAVVCVGALNFGHISKNALSRFIAVTKEGGYICFSTREDFYQLGSKEVQDNLVARRKWQLIDEKLRENAIKDMSHRHWLYRVFG